MRSCTEARWCARQLGARHSFKRAVLVDLRATCFARYKKFAYVVASAEGLRGGEGIGVLHEEVEVSKRLELADVVEHSANTIASTSQLSLPVALMELGIHVSDDRLHQPQQSLLKKTCIRL